MQMTVTDTVHQLLLGVRCIHIQGEIEQLTDTMWVLIAGSPNGPVLFCWLASVVCHHMGGRRTGRRARRRSSGRHCTAGQYDYVSL